MRDVQTISLTCRAFQRASSVLREEDDVADRTLSKSVINMIVRVLFYLWVVQLTRMMRRQSHLGAGIVWGAIPSCFPVFWIAVPGYSRNGYGTSLNLWVQKKFVKFRQSTQDTRPCPTEFFWKFLSYPPFDLFGDLGEVMLSQFMVKRVLRSTASSIFGYFPRNRC